MTGPSERTRALAERDKRCLWHPFTQMADWCAPDHTPLVIESGEGALLRDTDGNTYVDGNSSIWTNIHGHCHPVIDEAIRAQLEKLAHCSALGFTNEPAIQLAEALVGLFPENTLTRVFLTDNGSTAIECACKMALQYWQLKGGNLRDTFIVFDRAYHGDTAGAASLGGIQLFHERFESFGYRTLRVAGLDELKALSPVTLSTVVGIVMEPLLQGAARMRLWPDGMLKELDTWRREQGLLLLLDEVMTGFGRTGKMFACEHEGVVPDFIALAKGLSGGYLPLAATLTTEEIFETFMGGTERTFFYGHSYCGNPLGCAAAVASLRIFREEDTLGKLPEKIAYLKDSLDRHLGNSPFVGEIRQRGMIAGIDVLKDPEHGISFPAEDFTGARICREARKHGLLTRPIGDTLVLMPPLCITPEQIDTAALALRKGLDAVVGAG